MNSDMDDFYRDLAESPLGNCLDVGCGEGDFLEEFLARNLGVSSVLGVDSDPNAVSEARRYFGKFDTLGSKVRFLRADVLDPNFDPGQSFDTLLFGLVLHHFPEPKTALSGLLRFLRPGGRVLVQEMLSDELTPSQAVGRDIHHFKARIDTALGIPHFPTFSSAELKANLEVPDLSWSYYDGEPALDGAFDSREIEVQCDFLESYVQHLESDSEYPALRREAAQLQQRVRESGYLPQPFVYAIGSSRG